MTDVSKLKFPASIVVAIAGCLATSAGGVAVAQYRIAEYETRLSEFETRLSEVERERAKDRELLVRIDERTAEMKRILERSNAEISRIAFNANEDPDS